jgi:hypothetical protein
MSRTTITILAIAILLTACAAPNQTYNTSTSPPASTAHNYELLINDSAGHPLDGAHVSWTISGPVKNQNDKCTTDSQGTCRLAVQPYTERQSPGALFSNVLYSASKPGYFSGTGELSSFFGSSRSPYTEFAKNNPVKGSIVLYNPADYLSEELLNSAVDRELREQTLKFISLIRLQALIVDAEVSLRGASTSNFKGKKYFQMKINTTTSYNSLKLDKYSIAKKLFDDSIRKILNPLNENISNPKTFYGYDLIVYGYTKSFAEKYASPEKIEYRFLIPQEAVSRYKNKDISGQQLLDTSVILMNDERIDLKLQ